MEDAADAKVTPEVSAGKARTRELAGTRSSWLQLPAADLFLSQGGYGEKGFAGSCFEMLITGAVGGRVKFCDLIPLGPSRQQGLEALLPAVLLCISSHSGGRLLCGKLNHLTCLITDKRSEWDIRPSHGMGEDLSQFMTGHL